MITNKTIQLVGKNIHIQQIKVHQELTAPTLIFLHEGLGSIAQWKDFPKAICEASQLNGIVYDRLGHGQSDPVDEARRKDYLEVEALTFLPTLIKQLSIQNPILIGHSDGGSIALVYAANYPVKALITMAAHIFVEEAAIKGIKKALTIFENPSNRNKFLKYHQKKTDALIAAWGNTWLAPWFQDWNISSYLPQIKVPSLLLQGANDEYATPQHLDHISKGITGVVERHLIAHCGHSPHVEATDVTLDLVVGFLDRFVVR